MGVVFFLGDLDASGAVKVNSSELETESEQFGDIVIGQFVDTYRNLTRKTIMGYEWLTSFCLEAQFVVKTDDDVLVNIFKLTKDIEAWLPTDATSSNIWCAVHWRERVIRDRNSAFYASPIDFPDYIFPKHCAGVGYVTTNTVINRIIDEISRSFLGRICTHEDVFMTGIVTQKINSIQNHNPINLIDKLDAWVIYSFQNDGGDNDLLFKKLVALTANATENLLEFQERFGTKVFFLLPNDEAFGERYMKIWQVIKKLFQYEAGKENKN